MSSLLKRGIESGALALTSSISKKECLEDGYPLSQINKLVDATVSGHEFLTFMEAFLGYDQIQMVPEDEEKITFTTDRGPFYYRVMSFGLKNIGVTY